METIPTYFWVALSALVLSLAFWLALQGVKIMAQIRRDAPTLAETLDRIAHRTVQAAAQFLDDNQARKAWAVQQVFEWAKIAGLPITMDMVDEAIERAVFILNDEAAFLGKRAP